MAMPLYNPESHLVKITPYRENASQVNRFKISRKSSLFSPCPSYMLRYEQFPLHADFRAMSLRTSGKKGEEENSLSLYARPQSIRTTAQKMISEIESHQEIGALSEIEKKILITGLARILQADYANSINQEYLDVMIEHEKQLKHETSHGRIPMTSKFVLDSEQIQIARKLAADNFQRFGVVLDHKTNMLKTKVELESVYEESHVDLPKLAPEIARYVNKCHKDGKLVLAILGPARVCGDETEKILRSATEVLDAIMSFRGSNLAILTGGYKGELDGKYGATRAGYDIAKARGIDSLVIMPRAGEKDSHVNATVKNIVGEMWGDETKALVAAIDAAIVFEPHGLWTEIEVANLEKQNKHFCRINTAQDETTRFKIINDLNKHPSLRPEELKKKYNPEIPFERNQPFHQRKQSSQFDHLQQCWVQELESTAYNPISPVDRGR